MTGRLKAHAVRFTITETRSYHVWCEVSEDMGTSEGARAAREVFDGNSAAAYQSERISILAEED